MEDKGEQTERYPDDLKFLSDAKYEDHQNRMLFAFNFCSQE
jgi:hypothetical protein